MADWTQIPDATFDTDRPILGSTHLAIVRNFEALAEGAAGAPLISGALTKVIDQQEIGAFIFARGPSTTAYGSVVSGSSLTYAGAISSASAGVILDDELQFFNINAGASGSPSGSWVCLGRIEVTSNAGGTGATSSSATAATLWQRVA